MEERLKMADNIITRPRFIRKRYIVARGFQLKYTGIILLLMFVMAAFCSYVIYYTTMMLFAEKLANVYPQGQLIRILDAVNLRILLSMLIISPIVGFLGIYLSHKIAGPIYRIEKFLKSMAAGDLTSRITLRKGDELISLADAVNRFAAAFGVSITGEKARLENVLRELNNLKELISSSSGDRTRINNAINSLDSEIRTLSDELNKYKV